MNCRKADLEIALKAVEQSCFICERIFAEEKADLAFEKGDLSPVTVADYASQALIAENLFHHFPEDLLLAEENTDDIEGGSREGFLSKISFYLGRETPSIVKAIDRAVKDIRGSSRYWVLDPIDGTKGFLRGGQYAIALALIEKGTVVLGVLGCPRLSLEGVGSGLLCYAVKGGGCFTKPLQQGMSIPLQVSSIKQPSEIVLCESYDSSHSSRNVSEAFAKHFSLFKEPLRIDSQCKYAAVALGQASLYMRISTTKNYQEKTWDHAAGSLLVEEAGGKVTDVMGRVLDFSQGAVLSENVGIIAGNGQFHEEIINFTQVVGK